MVVPWLRIVIETNSFRLEVTDGYAVALVCAVMAMTILGLMVAIRFFDKGGV